MKRYSAKSISLLPISCLLLAGLGLASVAASSATAETPPAVGPVYNGAAQISLRLVNLVLERQIFEQQTVSDEVAGAQTVAETTTKGRLRLEFVPSTQSAVVDFRLVGELSAPNATAMRGQVVVRMASQTTIDARKRLIITPQGLIPAPSEADCRTETEILDVESDWRVLERLGRRRAEKLRPEAQQSASQQVAERVESELDAQARNPLVEANRFYREKFRLPLTAQGAFPRDLRLSSTSTHLELRMLAAAPGQSPPQLIRRLNPRFDIAVYGHESAVANLAEALVGGKTFEDRQFLELIRIFTGSADRGLWVFDGRPRWNVTFAKRQPIQVKFEDGVFRLTFCFEAATCGNDTVQVPIEAAATFRPEITPDGVRLIRQSAPTIAFTDSQPDTSARANVRQQLTERLTAFFQEDMYFDGLAPPAGGTWAKLRELKLTRLTCENGWFTIGYELNEPSKVAAQPK